MSDIVSDDPTHTPGTPRGEDLEPPATETKGATDRPVGQVEGDLMEPNNSGSGTSDVD
ncbi:MAG TPA: hypothetical protein VM942_06680 [Acidimicrobiales bacterium]|nr:hypothetical protein [Acidimicrobiales bacterium]